MTFASVSNGATRLRSLPFRAAWPVALLVLAVGACGGDTTDPGGSQTVSTVELAGATTTLEVGETVQLTATARDADGNIVVGKAFAWTSTNQAVATVTPQGLVVGQTVGAATINATVDGKSGSYQVAVIAATIPAINSITPATLVPGQPATLTGTNFSVSPANNVVTVGGVTAAVTAAGATSLTITVPSALCVPGSAVVKVTVNGRASNEINQSAEARGQQVTVALGQQVILGPSDDPCLQFASSTGSEEYLVGVQSVSESVSSLTSLNVGLAAAGSAGPPPVEPFSIARPMIPTVVSDRVERWRRHRQAEIEFRIRERATIEPFLPELARNRARTGGAPTTDVVSAIPVNVSVGDAVAIRVPDRNGSLCNDFASINTTVKAVGTRSVWLEDNANPAGGFTTPQYQNLASQFDNTIYATDATYFGNPSDIDGNSRIVIVVTKEVNRAGVLGFTSTSDQIPIAQCPSSNVGEFYYSVATDANGQFGSAYPVDEALLDAPLLLAHELAHIMQFSVRIALGTTILPRIWELEGQATVAEEVNGHAFAGRTPRSNLGFEFAFNCNDPPGCNDSPDPIDWYLGGFIDLVLFYGFDTATNRVAGAPEQCSWLDLSTNGNGGPCKFQGREVYGVPWSLLRYISDQFGPGFPGGEAGLHRSLINGTTQGFANIERVVGVPMRTLLARWAASLYTDDRVTPLDESLKMLSWNLFDIGSALVESAQLVPKNGSFGGFNETVMVRGGSTAYYRLNGPNRPAGAFRVRTGNGGLPPSIIQVWVVRIR